MKVIAFWVVASMMCMPFACSSDDDNETLSSEGALGAEGGKLGVTNNEVQATLVVPEGALKEDVDLVVSAIDTSSLSGLPTGLSFASAPVAYTPHGQIFETPITIEFSVSETLSNPVIARLTDENANTWSFVPTVVDGDRIYASVTSFSVYAVVDSDCAADAPDEDEDGVCDQRDVCPNDLHNDIDDDGVCDSDDPCPENPDNTDPDGDGICGSEDVCPNDATNTDPDNDGLCAAADPCPDDPSNSDPDNDGICGTQDTCPMDNPNDSDEDGNCDSAQAKLNGAVTLSGNIPNTQITLSIFVNDTTIQQTLTVMTDPDWQEGDPFTGEYDVLLPILTGNYTIDVTTSGLACGTTKSGSLMAGETKTENIACTSQF